MPIIKVGNYRLSKLIGSGGMSSVYEAEHEILGNKVAIKILNSIFSLSEVVRERFKNEARIMASLNHPNIARIIDFDEQPQQLSIIMELYEGEDLNSRIHRSGPLSYSELRDVFGQVLSALQYAHDNGVIHRDIKPSNIYLLPNGQIKVLDFGIAKVYGQGHEMTQTGQQIGTPVYMSPEQVRSEKTIDHRTDIYSLGVTMFFSLNGNPPYDSTNESHFSILTKIVNEPIPVLKVNDKFNTIISKACAKDPSQRFNNCRDFYDLLNNEHQSPISNEIKIFKNDNLTIDSSNYDVTITSNIDINNTLNDDIEWL
jgi:serine/threonine protein kinase